VCFYQLCKPLLCLSHLGFHSLSNCPFALLLYLRIKWSVEAFEDLILKQLALLPGIRPSPTHIVFGIERRCHQYLCTVVTCVIQSLTRAIAVPVLLLSPRFGAALLPISGRERAISGTDALLLVTKTPHNTAQDSPTTNQHYSLRHSFTLFKVTHS
jgi:hypothetical protein